MSEVLRSQLAHVELISPKPAETVKWMEDILGLETTIVEGRSAYLRGWGEFLHSSLVVTEGPEPAVGHIAWRAYGPEDPDTLAGRLKDTDAAIGWVESAVGHGRAFQYRAPVGGHVHELFWESDRYQAPPEKAPDLKGRPQRPPLRGAQARYIDHVTINSAGLLEDLAFYTSIGHRNTARTTLEPGRSIFATTTCNAIRSTHDLAVLPDGPGNAGLARVNHLAYRVDQRLDVERAAEAFQANGTAIEFGPGIHGMDEITYLYVREPGGFRIELNAGGCENTLPDWEAPDWHPSEGPVSIWKNIQMPKSMMESFPPVADAPPPENTQAHMQFVGGKP